MNAKARRLFVLARDKHTCQYCLKRPETLTLDHVIPKSHGGMNRKDNLVACCWDCNDKRRNMELAEWCGQVACRTNQTKIEILVRILRQISINYDHLTTKEQLKMVGAIY